MFSGRLRHVGPRLTERKYVYHPSAGYESFREVLHHLASDIDEVVFAMLIYAVAVGQFQYDGACFYFDVLEQFLGRIQEFEDKMR